MKKFIITICLVLLAISLFAATKISAAGEKPTDFSHFSINSNGEDIDYSVENPISPHIEIDVTFMAKYATDYYVKIKEYGTENVIYSKKVYDADYGNSIPFISIPKDTLSYDARYTLSVTASNEYGEITSYGSVFTIKQGQPSFHGDILTTSSCKDISPINRFDSIVYGNGIIPDRIYCGYEGEKSGIIFDITPNSSEESLYNKGYGDDVYLSAGQYTIKLYAEVEGKTYLLKTQSLTVTETHPPKSFQVTKPVTGTEYSGNLTSIYTEWTQSEEAKKYYISLYNNTKGEYIFQDVNRKSFTYYEISKAYVDMESLTPGEYTFTVVASNDYGTSSASTKFYIKSDTVLAYPEWSGTDLKDTYDISDTVALSGKIDGCGGVLENVYATITDETGITKTFVSETINKSTYSSYNIINFVCGDSVITAPGVYKIEMFANDVDCDTVKIYSKSITVKKRNTFPGVFNIISPVETTQGYPEFVPGEDVYVEWSESTNTEYYTIRIEKHKTEEKTFITLGNVLKYTIPADKFSGEGIYTITVLAHDEDDDKEAAYVNIAMYYPDEVYFDRAYESIDIGYASGDSKDSVTSNLVLNQYFDPCIVYWSSNKEQYIKSDGTVTRPDAGDVTVKITAKAVYVDLTKDKVFYVTVKGKKSNEDVLSSILNDVSVGFCGYDTADSVTTNLMLFTTGTYSSKISWSSDNGSIVSKYGDVVRPQYDTKVKLTATATYNGASASKDFYIIVKGTVGSGNITPVPKPTLTSANIPATLTIGDTFTMSGTVNGNGGKLEKVYINVFKTDENGYNKILCDRSGLGVTAFNLSNVGAVVSGKDYFDKEGTYTLYIHAKNEGGESIKLAEKTITVRKSAENTPTLTPVPKPTLTSANIPAALTIGDTFTMSGTVSGNGG
ncbi:MAG: hypothetical protein MJ131_03645, partial [Lachnospiraceae bacterium]|nr:hypothetical protein [Lachnospiraceae bacterium]